MPVALLNSLTKLSRSHFSLTRSLTHSAILLHPLSYHSRSCPHAAARDDSIFGDLPSVCYLSIALLRKVSLPLREGLLGDQHSCSNKCWNQQVRSVYGHQSQPVMERQGCSCNLRKAWDHRCGGGDSVDGGWDPDPGSSQCIRIGTCTV